jgi:hypothetical protein
MVDFRDRFYIWPTADFPGTGFVFCVGCILIGMGAVCNEVRTGGPWTEIECKKHINFLELLAALKAPAMLYRDGLRHHRQIKDG